MANRDVTLGGTVFASSANTTIPSVPVSGTPYRNTGVTPGVVSQGWPFEEKVDSANFNQVLYLYSSLLNLIEKDGVLKWSNQTDYSIGSLCSYVSSDDSNYGLFIALKASGPSTSAVEPLSAGSDTYWQSINSSLNSVHNVFDVFMSVSSNPPQGAFDLSLGTLISNCETLYPDFWSKLNDAVSSGYVRSVTEVEWQDEVTKNGSCGGFVIDSVTGDVRLPKILNVSFGQDSTVDNGEWTNPKLPNSVGDFTGAGLYGGTQTAAGSGAVQPIPETDLTIEQDAGRLSVDLTGGTANAWYKIDLSEGETERYAGAPAIYDGNQVVTPGVRLSLYIQVYNSAVEISRADTAQLWIQYERLERRLFSLDYVVDQGSRILNGNYCWWKVFRSGWCEQGGDVIVSTAGSQSIDFPVSFNDTNYQIFKNVKAISDSNASLKEVSIVPQTRALASTYSSGGSFQWFARGLKTASSYTPIAPFNMSVAVTGTNYVEDTYDFLDGVFVGNAVDRYVGVNFVTGNQMTITLVSALVPNANYYECQWVISGTNHPDVKSQVFNYFPDSGQIYPWMADWGDVVVRKFEPNTVAYVSSVDAQFSGVYLMNDACRTGDLNNAFWMKNGSTNLLRDFYCRRRTHDSLRAFNYQLNCAFFATTTEANVTWGCALPDSTQYYNKTGSVNLSTTVAPLPLIVVDGIHCGYPWQYYSNTIVVTRGTDI